MLVFSSLELSVFPKVRILEHPRTSVTK
uniref:Uncharacterized protein n=1 Tax=Rhizophora mucronata TaxID=61149 RepID=A0A2P2R3P6_RHIMU